MSGRNNRGNAGNFGNNGYGIGGQGAMNGGYGMGGQGAMNVGYGMSGPGTVIGGQDRINMQEQINNAMHLWKFFVLMSAVVLLLIKVVPVIIEDSLVTGVFSYPLFSLIANAFGLSDFFIGLHILMAFLSFLFGEILHLIVQIRIRAYFRNEHIEQTWHHHAPKIGLHSYFSDGLAIFLLAVPICIISGLLFAIVSVVFNCLLFHFICKRGAHTHYKGLWS